MSESKECRHRVEYYLNVLDADTQKLRQDVQHLANVSQLETNDFVLAFSDLRAVADGVRIVRTMIALQMNAEMPDTVSMISANLANALPVLLDLEYIAELSHEDIADVIEAVAEKTRRKRNGPLRGN